jgi:ParB family chromosome partitioning protein
MAKTPMTIPSSKVSIALAAGSTAAAMKAAEAGNGKLYMVPIAKIKPIPGFNVRVDSPDYRAHRDMLADSMRANGYDETKALAGYVAKEGDENVIYVTDGYTRLDAASILNGEKVEGFDKLPVIVRATAPSITDLTVALHTNNTGRPLTPFELGVVVKRLLKEDGADKKAIAARLAVTPRYLDDVLLLVNSPKKVREAVLEGNVSSTMAIQELRKAGDEPDKAAERIEAAVAKAKASGKTKATKKDVGVRMQKIRSTVSVAEGTDMKEIVKAVAAKVREAIKSSADGDGDDAIKLAAVDGTISIVIEVPAPEKPKPVKKAAAKKAPAAAKVEPKIDAEPAKKPAAKKAAAKKTAKPAAKPPVADEDENISANDIDIDGAEEVTSEGQDDEPAIMPPKVESETVGDDEEVDI